MLQQLRQHSQSAYPNECCGVLLGNLVDGERQVKSVFPCSNALDSLEGEGARAYFIPPEQLISAQKLARETGCDIVGFYHSHPDEAARWSERDLREAHWFACSYVITSVERGLPTRTQSYVLAGTSEQDKRFDDEQIVTT